MQHFLHVADDAPVRARFSLPFVARVGSHEGCGCGFNSGELEWEGFERVEEVAALGGAMSAEERDELKAEQRSRERLHELVVAALRDGPVEVFGSWDGDEGLPAVGEEEVEASHFVARVAPIVERMLWRVRRP